MSTRSVRLDEEAESALAEIIGRTGLSISEAIKKGLIEYRNEARNIALKSPASFSNNSISEKGLCNSAS